MRGEGFAFALFFCLAGCSTETVTETRTERGTAVDHGHDLFSDPTASPAPLNTFACSTCHAAEPPLAGDDRLLPGGILAGVVERPTFWGGQEQDLLRSINYCRYYFMGAQDPWTTQDEEARAMYAYLTSLSAAASGAQPLTVVSVASDLAAGDGGRGKEVYRRSCVTCHGQAHTGEGRHSASIPVLPEESVAYFESVDFDPTEVRITFVEKVRHGAFLGLYGFMPFYSTETMSDAELSDLLAYLELY